MQQDGRNIDVIRTRHAIFTIVTRDKRITDKLLGSGIQEIHIVLCQRFQWRISLHIFLQMFHVRHATEDGQHIRMGAGKTEGPRCNGHIRTTLLQDFGNMGMHIGQTTTQQRLHNHSRNVSLGKFTIQIFGIDVSRMFFLSMTPVYIVQLNLHEVPGKSAFIMLVQRNTTKNLKELTDVTELIGKDIYVKPGKYLNRLQNLDKELGGGIRIHEVSNDSITIEDLIMQVSNGTINYTLCDNDLARLNKTYYTNLDISLQVSFDQRASWAVRKTSPLLAEAANIWHGQNKTSPAYKASTKRYFENRKRLPHGPILSIKDGKISHFDHLFKKYGAEIGWDWRLIASLAYNESNFDTTAVSWVGTKGLMQLMPKTARAMGVPEGKEQNAEESVKAATKYLALLAKTFSKVTDPNEKIKFILGSYNAGIGHIYDAMALAEKYGKDKYVWDGNVETYILLKSHEEYFNDPVCKNGYFRGRETYNFVKDILGRAEMYKEKIKGN